MELPIDVLDAAYQGETLFGGDVYGQSLVQEFGKMFLSRNSGHDDPPPAVRPDFSAELVLICSDICSEGPDVSEEKINQLAQCFLDILTENCQNEELELDKVLSDLSRSPGDQEPAQVVEAVRRVLSSRHSRATFLQPGLTAELVQSLPLAGQPRHVLRQLVLMFHQEATQQDQAVASLLLLLSPLGNLGPLLDTLDVSSYYSLHVLVRLEEERKPTLAPIPVEQITEATVYEKVNILSKCSSLTTFDIVRYCLHISDIDVDCALHFLQNFVLELPLAGVLYICLAHYEAHTLLSSAELSEAVQSDFQSLLVRSAATHLPGWSEDWSLAMDLHPALASYLAEALRLTNEARLSKVANLVGAHKAGDSLEVVSLADFLASRLSLSPTETASFYHQTHSLVGLARLACQHREVAVSFLPLIIELGDVGQSQPQHHNVSSLSFQTCCQPPAC